MRVRSYIFLQEVVDVPAKQGDEDPGKIRIFVNDKPYFAPKPAMTGVDIKDLGGIPRDYQLFKEVPGRADDLLVRDDETVNLKSGDKFHGIVPGNLG